MTILISWLPMGNLPRIRAFFERVYRSGDLIYHIGFLSHFEGNYAVLTLSQISLMSSVNTKRFWLIKGPLFLAFSLHDRNNANYEFDFFSRGSSLRADPLKTRKRRFWVHCGYVKILSLSQATLTFSLSRHQCDLDGDGVLHDADGTEVRPKGTQLFLHSCLYIGGWPQAISAGCKKIPEREVNLNFFQPICYLVFSIKLLSWLECIFFSFFFVRFFPGYMSMYNLTADSDTSCSSERTREKFIEIDKKRRRETVRSRKIEKIQV